MQSANNRAHNRTVLASAKPGDIIRFSRVCFSHDAIYEGNGKVIHVAADGNHTSSGPQQLLSVSSVNSDKAKVSRDSFWNVAKNSRARINNMDDKYEPLPAKEIVASAKSKVGQTGYNVCFNNCQHFATETRYGVAMSDEVSTAVVYFVAAAVTAGVAYAGYKAWEYFRGQKNENK